jgi:hypothetical protein
MNPLRSRAMIASAMSLVRPARRAAVEPRRRSRYAVRPDAITTEPPGGGPISLDPIDQRPAATSYSLIGW